jgi:hypothetical protein
MCFSAEASFGTSGVLFVAGLASLSNVKRSSQVILASTPLIFSVQQLSEGLLWISLHSSQSYFVQHGSMLFFVTVGQIFWPIWVPLSVLVLEKDLFRKKMLKIFLGLGILVSASLLYLTIIYPITAQIMDHHIKYFFDYKTNFYQDFSLFYLVPSVFSNFLSSDEKIRRLGWGTLIAFVISKVLFFNFVFSVWCFFSALISFYIFFVIRSQSYAFQQNEVPRSSDRGNPKS